jgi:NADH:ubiquinone oxidoreductase subunit 6 (subunit J)
MRTPVGSAVEGSQARRVRRLTLPVSVVLLLGVVALASRAPLRPPGASPAGTPTIGNGTPLSPWTLVLLGIGAAIVLGSFALHRSQARRSRADRRPMVPELVQLALLASLVLLGALLATAAILGSHRAQPSQVRLGHPHALDVGARVRSVFQFPLWAQLSVAALVLAACLLMAIALGRPTRARYARALPRRGRPTELPAVPSLAPTMADAIGRSLEDLEADPDPRRAIIAAYGRMEESLADAGLPRTNSETAREYLSRGLVSLELSPSTIGTLTMLFERAKFSLRPVDLRLRDEAIAALRALQQELA